MKSIIPLWLLLLWPFCNYSQKTEVVELESFKDFFNVKIAWADSSGFGVISDKKPGEPIKLQQVISWFDRSGSLKYSSDNFKTEYSSSSYNALVLGKTIIYLTDISADYGHFRYVIEYSFTPEKKLSDVRTDVFDISTNKEADKLNNEKYAFRTYKGCKGKKALFTYNNDYKDPLKEGFLYRTIDEKMQLSAIDTFQYPYYDRLCNIDEILYDDENDKIYILTELFIAEGKNDRKYNKHIVAEYDIKNKTYRELDGIPSFKDHFTQTIASGYFGFSGISYQKKDQSEFSAIIFDPQELKLKSVFHEKLIDTLMNEFCPKSDIYINPSGMLLDDNNVLHCFWNHCPDMEDVRFAERKKLKNIYPGYRVGGANPSNGPSDTYTGLVMATDKDNNNNTLNKPSHNLWIQCEREKEIKICYNESKLKSREFSRLSFAPLLLNHKAFLSYNKEKESRRSSASVFMEDNQKYNEVLNKQLEGFIILPASVFKQGDGVYFLGHKLDVNNDLDRDEYSIVKISQ